MKTQRRRSIPLRLILVAPFVIQMFSAVSLVGFLSYQNGQKAVNEVASQLRSELSQRIEEKLKTYKEIPHAINRFNASAFARGVIDVSGVKGEAQMWEQMQTYPDLSGVYCGDENGSFMDIVRSSEQDRSKLTLIFSNPSTKLISQNVTLDSQGNRTEQVVADNPSKPYDPRVRPWYKAARTAGQNIWSEIYLNNNPLYPTLTASVPVYSPTNKSLIGVCATDLFLPQEMSKFLQGLSIGKTGTVFIVERSGQLVATSGKEPILKGTGENATRLAAVDSPNPTIKATAQLLGDRFQDLNQIRSVQQIDFNTQGKKQYIQVMPFKDLNLDWLIVITIPESDFMEQINANTNTTVLLCLGALALAVISGIYTSRWISQPITRLNKASQGIAKGNLDQEIQPENIEELDKLGQIFNEMSDQLQESFDSLRLAEEKYRSIFENAVDGIVQATPGQGSYLNINPAFARIFGYDSPTEMIESITNISEQLYVDPQRRAEFQLLLETQGYVKEFEYRAYRKDGSIIWIQNDARAVKDDDGNVLYYEGFVRDITDRKQAEEALRQSEAINRTIVAAIPDLMIRVKGDGTYDVIGKDRVKRDYGVKAVINVGSINVQEALPQESIELLMHDIQKALATDELQIHEHRIIINGEHRDEERRIMVSGEDEVLVIIRDITDRKQAEEDLLIAEENYRSIFENALDGIFQISAAGRLTNVNPAYARMHGYNSPKEMIESITTVSEMFVDPQHQAELRSLLGNQGFVKEIEGRAYCKDGSIIWTQLDARAVKDDEGNVLYYEGFVRDITDRKKAEQALVESKTRYQQVVETQTDFILRSFPDTTITFANPSLCRALGLSLQELIGMKWIDFTNPEDLEPTLQKIAGLNPDNPTFLAENRDLRVNGTIGWTQWLNQGIFNLEGELVGIQSVGRDITDRKQAEEALRHSEEEVRLANIELEARVDRRTSELRQEKEKSEKLLLNILPGSIADRLKTTNESIADHFEEVTILFADIVGFTTLSARMKPLQLVEGLNYIFSAFDQMTEKYGLEKIKTIGDAYMVVGGLPISKPDHVEAIANMALEMQACMTEIENVFGESLQIRIGINTGEVIAGVIGTKKFIYDLWGDAVNVASRMESHGKPGHIQVTDTTYERLKERYILEQRGVVEVKGCGEMMTYWLIGSR